MGFPARALPLTKDQAAQIAQAHVQALRNPSLMLGEITEFEAYYEALVVAKDGSLAEKLWVDKRSGWMRGVY